MRILLGHISTAHGIRGEVLIKPLTDDPADIAAYGPLSDEAGLFWFFNKSNYEALLKVLDGCALNDHYWVFFAATTNLGLDILITDTATGQQKRYTNPSGQLAQPIGDSTAFGGCP